MNDTIYRQVAIDKVDSLYRDAKNDKCYMITGYNHALSDMRVILNALPSAQSERKKGKWIKNDNGTYTCSVCQSWIPEEQHYYARYCLYCGADMRGEDNG